MSHSLRTKKAASVSFSLREGVSFRGNQGEVWNGIENLSQAAKVHSGTGAMRDVFEGKKSDLDDYLKAFPYVPRQKGILVMIDGKVIGFDMLSLEAVYEVLHPKLTKSYAMDALLQEKGEVGNGSMDRARAFVEEAGKCKEEKFKSVGHGWDHRFEAPRVVGSALVHEEKVIRAAFFAATESEKAGAMSSASRRRRYRV